jgi:alpha-tubulin suppressor-like RCC1 family protein
LGTYNSYALRNDGTLWGWGDNGADWPLVGSATAGNKSTPIQIASGGWNAIAGGQQGGYGIKSDGTVWCWGSNVFGHLGYEFNSPIQVGTGTIWSDVSASSYESMAVRSNGTLWAWGWHETGNLALGNAYWEVPVMAQCPGTAWSKVVVSVQFGFGLRTDGSLWSWGLNTDGQLGLGHTTLCSTPVQVGALTKWLSISAGTTHAAAKKAN